MQYQYYVDCVYITNIHVSYHVIIWLNKYRNVGQAVLFCFTILKCISVYISEAHVMGFFLSHH